jgi:hypothetical protein
VCYQHTDNISFSNHSYIPASPTDSSHGCNKSLTSENGSAQPLQPHDPVTINNKNNKATITTIYTQNVRGLWCRPHDREGNILLDYPPDTSKLKQLIDFMRTNDVGAWLIQETREEGDEINIIIGGYHVF